MKAIGVGISSLVLMIITLCLVSGLFNSDSSSNDDTSSHDYTKNAVTQSSSKTSDTKKNTTDASSVVEEESPYDDDPIEEDNSYYNYIFDQYFTEGEVAECQLYGRINTHGETVASFNSSYVVNGGKAARVRKSLGNGWHIVAVRCCYTMNIWWYELYDSQDGDYYGWVDSDFIDFD